MWLDVGLYRMLNNSFAMYLNERLMVAKLCIALAYAFWHCTLGHKVEVIQILRSFSQSAMEREWSTSSKSVGCGNYMRSNWHMLAFLYIESK